MNPPPPARSAGWVALVLCSASLCFSLWATLHQTRLQGFFAHYGLVSLGIATTAGTTANLLSPRSPVRRWLMVAVWICLAISFIGLYQTSH
jgi:hypothetical protein